MDRALFWPRRVLALDKTWGKNLYKRTQWFTWMQKHLKKIENAVDIKELVQLEKELYSDYDMKIYAIRRALETGLVTPKERDDLEKDPDTLLEELDWRTYQSSTPTFIKLHFHVSGRERSLRIPNLKDQAMEALVSLYFEAVLKSRVGAHSFGCGGNDVFEVEPTIVEVLKDKKYAMTFSVKVIDSGQYEKWILKNVPIQRRILESFIDGGTIASQLFPEDQISLRLNTALSPLIAAYSLSGIDKRVPTIKLIRYNDKFLLLSEDKEELVRARENLRSFLLERGINIDPVSLRISNTTKGFSFLSKNYRLEKGEVTVSPDESAKAGLITFINDIVWNVYAKGLGSRKEIVMDINTILKIWRDYHRASDHEFVQIDRAILQILVSENHDQSWKKTYREVLDSLRVLDSDGSYHANFSTKQDLKLFELSLPYSRYQKTALNRRYYLKELSCCALCGRQIYYRSPAFQVITPEGTPNFKLHKACADNIYETISRFEAGNSFYTYDFESEWVRMREEYENEQIRKLKIPTGRWVYWRLYQFFREESRKTFSLTFSELEEISDCKLPREAYRSKYYWRSKEKLDISDAWILAGYELEHLDLKRHKLWFSCKNSARDQIKIPPKLRGEVSLTVKVIFENFLDYFLDKYFYSDKT